MSLVKLGLVAAVIIAAVLGLLFVTEALPADQIADIALWSFGGVVVLEVAALLLQAMRGNADQRDRTDQPVP